MSAAPPVLHGYVPLGALPDISPFVTKVENYLALAGVAYAKRVSTPAKAPRGKLPYLEHAGEGIPDSAEILAYLARAGLAELDASLDDDQRAELSAMRSMLELELYFIVSYYRWQDEGGWSRYRPIIRELLGATGVPRLLQGPASAYLRRNEVAALHAQGVGRRDSAELLARARELFDTLERWLARRGDARGPWWFGAQPSSADAIAHAFLAHAARSGLQSPLDTLIDERPALTRWFAHVESTLGRG